jgi:CubicO group peptidase (beta-lactamase class C family)
MVSAVPSSFRAATAQFPSDKFATDVMRRLDQAVAEGRVWNIHGLLVLQNGKLIVERYFEGQDRERGVGDLGTVKFMAETLHDLRSCSKSIVALLYGIALQQRKVPAPEASLLSGFPEYRDLADEERSRVTVHHALSNDHGNRLG